MQKLLRNVCERLPHENISRLHYYDDEGDQVVLMNDDDLKDAVAIARASGKRILRLSFPKKKRSSPAKPKTLESSNMMGYATMAVATVATVAVAWSRKYN